MSFTVSVSARAQRDASRLDEWLSAYAPQAAERLGMALLKAFDTLTEMPLRGRIAGRTTRDLRVPFGRDAYIIRYRVNGTHVTVTRIWHSLENR